MYACYTAMWQGRIQDFGVEGALAGGPPGWNSPARGQGQSPGEGLGAKPEENHLRRGKKTNPYRLTLYDNIIIIIIIHSSFYVSSHFCLKIQNEVCGLQNQRNGPRRQPGKASLLKGTLP